ncbi:MAG: hypothetical protein IPP15_20700 [Saprospiraceae bacterium]|uniref:Uncharacterized protein n=1 Tax=Candidatus Opimibacter skivensis TaxID=2982028 RepID=A0A9D7XUF2_9BACT|nr:hypothetical protein [Candidatus Opimibacter skivensis]
MAKQVKQKAKTPIAPVVVPPSETVLMWKKYFPYIITGVFFILSLIGILNHEMWRDEYQAWMVARDAHSIPELFQNLKYEGNPVLWHAFLFAISAFTDNPLYMQIFHILISASTIFLISRYAPFPLLQKILLTFGYYTFFEYNIIARCYGLGLLLIVIFCILYKERQKNILLIGGVLFLLGNNTIFGVILAVSFAGIILYESLFKDKKSKAPQIPFSKLALFSLITFSGVLLGYLQIKPEPDNSFPTLYVTHFDIVRLKYTLSRFIHAYIAIPNFRNFHFWNTNFFVPDERKFLVGVTPVLFLLWLIAFLRNRLVFLLYTTGTLILLVFYYYTGFIWSRYSGHLFLLLIACCWMSYFTKEKAFQNGLMDKLSLFGSKIRTPFFVFILSIHVIGGVAAYAMDLEYPFSTSQKAADYIRQNKLDEFNIVGSQDYAISPLASELDKKIYYVERKEAGSFIIYDQKRTFVSNFGELINFAGQVMGKDKNRVILAKSNEITKTYNDNGQQEPWIDGMVTDSMSMTLLTKIEPGIVEDETYFIYAVDRVK